MNLSGLCLLLVSIVAVCNGEALGNTIDVKRLETILQEGVKAKDISTLYYAVKGLKILNAKIPDVCQEIKNFKYNLDDIEQIFYLTNAAALSGCVNYLKPDVLSGATRAMDKKETTIPELYYAVFSLKALGKGNVLEREEGLKNLVQLLKKDDSPTNYAYLFALCEHMGYESWTSKHAENVFLSADEITSAGVKMLHFEGGLPTTSLLLTTVIRAYKTLKKPTPLSEEQRYKLAEYLVSRRHVNSPRGAALLLDAAYALADDEPSPISIAIKGRKYITPADDAIEVTVSDILARPVKNLKSNEVVAQSGTRLTDDVIVLSKQPLTQKSGESTAYVLNLSKIKSQYGQYKIVLSAKGVTTNVIVAILGEIQVGSVEIGLGDVDGTTSPKVTTVAYPNKLAEKLQADHLQKLTLKFTVRDKSNTPVAVQQAFVRIGSANNEQETIFVAEPDNAKAYKVELNVLNLAKHLNHASGSYSVTVILGDSAVYNPISWCVGDVHFNFGKDANAIGASVKTTSKPHRGPLPEIRHSFRAPEPRPPRLVSDVFAAMCAAPLLLLLGLWAKLRVNLSYFPLSLCAIVFHLALGGSLALYALFWLKLTMFETVRYLLPLGLVTFLSGHRLLRRLVQEKSR